MVTISANDQKPRRYANTQFRYGLVYACVTFLVLLFLNLYTSKTSQMLFYKSKETSMIEKCQLSAAEISRLDVINTATISQTVNQMEGLNATRIIVTDAMGAAIYDSYSPHSALGQYVLISEIVYAMEGSTGNDVFCWRYYHSEGVMYSRAATPIVSYGQIVGCLYIMEADAEQGALIQRLQNNIMTSSLILMVVVILFSFLFAILRRGIAIIFISTVTIFLLVLICHQQ